MKNFRKTTLENGLKIITVPQEDNLATTVLILVETGSKYENKKNNGIAHFLEHMVFKGTKKRPTAMDIAGELDGLGAQYNAFTSFEYTGYYAKVEAHQADKAIDIISDIYLNPVFEEAEIEKEKGVIIEEYNMYEDMPRRNVRDIFTELLYGDQPAGWKVLGEKDIIRSLTKEDFLAFRKDQYMPSATTLVLTGSFEEEKVLANLKDLFASMPAGEKVDKLPVKESQEGPGVLLKYKESDQAHLMIGFRALNLFDEKKYALDVLANILGGGMSSRLFHKVREQLGAAYYVYGFNNPSTDHGYVAAQAGVDHAKLKEVIGIVLAEFKRFTNELVSEEELKKAKGNLAGTLLLGLETSDELGVYYGMQELLQKKVTTPEELLKKIDAITPEGIQEVAKKFFKLENLNMAIIGPYKEEGEFKQLLEF